MELKKSKTADINGWRSTFFLAGLAIILMLLNLAFEWKSHPQDFIELSGGMVIFEEDMVKITKQEKPEPKIRKKVFTNIKLVDNLKETDMRDEYLTADQWDPDVYFDTIEEPDYDEIPEEFYPFPEVQPEFRGNIQKYLAENVVYPSISRELGTEGTVYLNFKISSSGKVTNIKILRGVSPEIDAEAVRVLENMPLWKPAMQGDRKVSTSVGISIKFSLSN
jgi:protein TonB